MQELDPQDLNEAPELTPEADLTPEPAVEAAPEYTETTAGAAVPTEIVVEEIPAPKPVVETAPVKSRYKEPVAVTLDDIEAAPAPAGPAVVSNNERDEVKLSAIVFKNELARKSLSVHHLQRRLLELGYADAGKDRDGYFGDITRRAVARFQENNNLQPDGHITMPLLELLFNGDPNVELKAE